MIEDTPTARANVFASNDWQIRGDRPSAMEWKMLNTWGMGTRGQCANGQCRVCGTTLADWQGVIVVESEDDDASDGFRCDIPHTICDDCSPVVADHFEPPSFTAPIWEMRCPSRFKEWVLEAKPEHDGRKTCFATFWGRQVREWKPNGSGTGLIIKGPSGDGKTTACWALVRNLEMNHKIIAMFMHAVELYSTTAANAFRDRGDESIMGADVLILDDIGKESVNARYVATLWKIFDYRYGRQLPTIITTRLNREELVKHYSETDGGKSMGAGAEVRAQDIVGRMLNFAHTLHTRKDQ